MYIVVQLGWGCIINSKLTWRYFVTYFVGRPSLMIPKLLSSVYAAVAPILCQQTTKRPALARLNISMLGAKRLDQLETRTCC